MEQNMYISKNNLKEVCMEEKNIFLMWQGKKKTTYFTLEIMISVHEKKKVFCVFENACFRKVLLTVCEDFRRVHKFPLILLSW